MRIVLLLVLGLLAGCQSLAPLPRWQSPEGRDHPDLGLIVDLRSGTSLTPAQLTARLAGYEVVLVGERHDNPDHHALQLWLLRALTQARPQGSLLLEMLEPEQQARVDRVRRGLREGQSQRSAGCAELAGGLGLEALRSAGQRCARAALSATACQPWSRRDHGDLP